MIKSMNIVSVVKGLLMLALGLIPLLGIVQATHATQVCKEYIPDETPDTRYEVNVDGTVYDTLTGLTWMQCTVGLSGANCEIGSASFMTWRDALQTAAEMTFASYSDWQLPNENQLRSIVAYNCHSPAINVSIFPNTTQSLYWSSSPWAGLDGFVRNINFRYGNEGALARDINGYYVRLVR